MVRLDSYQTADRLSSNMKFFAQRPKLLKFHKEVLKSQTSHAGRRHEGDFLCSSKTATLILVATMKGFSHSAFRRTSFLFNRISSF